MNGNPYVINSPSDIKFISDKQFHQISLGRNGAWAVTNADRKVWFMDAASVTDPKTENWKEVSTPSGLRNLKLVSTILNVYLITDNGEIYLRDGIGKQTPSGIQWLPFNQGKDVAESELIITFYYKYFAKL